MPPGLSGRPVPHNQYRLEKVLYPLLEYGFTLIHTAFGPPVSDTVKIVRSEFHSIVQGGQCIEFYVGGQCQKTADADEADVAFGVFRDRIAVVSGQSFHS